MENKENKMKKDYKSELLIGLLAKRKQRLLENKKINEAKDNLSIQDKNSYEELVKKRKVYLEFVFTKASIKVFIIMFLIIVGILFYFGDISNLNYLREISKPIFILFLKVTEFALILDILSFFILPIIEMSDIKKLDRRLFLKK